MDRTNDTPRTAVAAQTREIAIIDIGSVLDLLAEAVDDRGRDYVYRAVWVDRDQRLTCMYAGDGVPGCLVGEVLARAGVPINELEILCDAPTRDLYFAGQLPVVLTIGALAVLHRVQVGQDLGRAWGEVLVEADEVAARFLELVPDSLLDQATRKAASQAPHRRLIRSPGHCGSRLHLIPSTSGGGLR